MKLRFTNEEMRTIINSLDFYSRIWIGQYDRILYDIRWYRDCNKLDENEQDYKTLLLNIRHILLPEIDYIGWNGSHGIFSPDIDFKAGVAYDMQQVFRYALAWFEHPEGGYGVDFGRPLPSETSPYEFPKATCKKIDDIIYEDIEICKEQLDIIKNALIINKALYELDIVKIFSFYTTDENAIKLAITLTNKLSQVKKEREPNLNNDAILESISNQTK